MLEGSDLDFDSENGECKMINGEVRKAWYSRDGLEASTDYEDVSDQVIDNQYCCQAYENDS